MIMGRPPIGSIAMSSTERSRRSRAAAKRRAKPAVKLATKQQQRRQALSEEARLAADNRRLRGENARLRASATPEDRDVAKLIKQRDEARGKCPWLDPVT